MGHLYPNILKGNIFNTIGILFDYPVSSKEIGVYKAKNLNENNIEININMVEFKYILTTINNETIALTLLHK